MKYKHGWISVDNTEVTPACIECVFVCLNDGEVTTDVYDNSQQYEDIYDEQEDSSPFQDYGSDVIAWKRITYPEPPESIDIMVKRV